MPLVTIQQFDRSDIEPAIELWQRSPGVGLGLSDTSKESAIFLKRNPGMSQVSLVGNRLVGAIWAALTDDPAPFITSRLRVPIVGKVSVED
jgi:hypothetical protein